MPVSRSVAAVGRSLESALGQSLREIEVLVGDDGEEGDKAVAAAGDARVDYRRNSPALGFTGNHEALISRARGEFVAILHDDDLWQPSYLERAVGRLRASPAAGFVLTAHREAPGGGIPPHPAAGSYAEALPILLDARVRLLPSATVMRREIFADVRRPWPALSCGDMVLYLDAALAGWGVASIDDPLVSYVRHPGQISADDTSFRRDLAALFELYRFGDPALERQRRTRLAGSWLSIARSDLKSGRRAEARAGVARARAARRGARTLAEGAALNALGRSPALLGVTLDAWYGLRGVPATAVEAAGER
jgi:glycosyltransferase involved in cell wall biosynthesis